MDFSWTQEQLDFKQKIVAFAKKELNSEILEMDRLGQFPREKWNLCAKFGILGLPIPNAYGGLEKDIMTATLAMEGLGYGCRDNGLTFALNAQMWSVETAILKFGTREQKEHYLPKICAGELIGAFGMTEPDSGSDAYSLKSSARKTSKGYCLTGHKRFVTFAPICDFALVFALSKPKLGKWGISAFIVDKGTPGFSTSEVTDKMGLKTVPMGEILLENCMVPERSRLGPEGGGISIFNTSMEWERSCILASQIGAMEHQLEVCLRFARERQQFGKPIGRFQSVSNRISDMKVRLETCRLLLYKVPWLKKVGKSAVMEAAMAKLYISECAVQSSLDAIKIHGTSGYITDTEIERDLRDAIGGTLYSGTTDIQRTIISQYLGL